MSKIQKILAESGVDLDFSSLRGWIFKKDIEKYLKEEKEKNAFDRFFTMMKMGVQFQITDVEKFFITFSITKKYNIIKPLITEIIVIRVNEYEENELSFYQNEKVNHSVVREKIIEILNGNPELLGEKTREEKVKRMFVKEGVQEKEIDEVYLLKTDFMFRNKELDVSFDRYAQSLEQILTKQEDRTDWYLEKIRETK